MKKVFCPYCGSQAEYADSKVVYGRSYGMIYLCRQCDAYVGVHKGTDKPLGRLADKELRYWKMAAHEAFDPIWKSRRMRRNDAYTWLAERMGLKPEETHIGMFDVPECKKVIKICNDERSFSQWKTQKTRKKK
ncbi:MAG: DUF3268 family zinc-finger domain-containing protein [Vallitaleaceae bacterium]|nr:DUF3268 family zinc-finger domain-containing protein [Vallitaleaceae bacterium]